MLINGIDCPHFKLHEFRCQCDCGLANPNPRLLERLNKARMFAKIGFHVTSGSRCRAHDEATYLKLGREWKGTSSHLPKGDDGWTDAVDVRTITSKERWLVVESLIHAGFSRIGFGDGFVHADVDVYKAQEVMWDYY